MLAGESSHCFLNLVRRFKGMVSTQYGLSGKPYICTAATSRLFDEVKAVKKIKGCRNTK